jgi:hypothetical protein
MLAKKIRDGAFTHFNCGALQLHGPAGAMHGGFGPDLTVCHALPRFITPPTCRRALAEVEASLQKDAADAIANMELVEAIYTAAGLRPRQPTHAWF